ncbi:MAG TPA: DUF4097 family beta strand repeat-containing protein [Candidatus Acidoferrales bacterium]|nr:DUF4097 family beta strand repeat-containing protein [Candidatus Acidoferrales bacterium]
MRKPSIRTLFAAFAIALLSLPLLARGASASPVSHSRDDWEDFPVKTQETIQKSFTLPASGHRSLDVDTVWGSIDVVGGSGNQVQVTIVKTIRARSDEAMQRAKKEVTLDTTQNGGDLKLYVNGPFRCNCDDCRGRGHHDDDDYVVQMDFKVTVPQQIDLQARTVDDGNVSIKNVSGDFEVRNVNGRIEMDSIAGSGSARTVNGPVTVSFRQNPRANSDFRTVNGAVELRFQQGLDAAFRMKTFNGGIYTDFPVTALPLRPVSEKREGGKIVFRADRMTGVQIGTGGPGIQIENLNGDIRILENHE